jgi:hypothetical protein
MADTHPVGHAGSPDNHITAPATAPEYLHGDSPECLTEYLQVDQLP